MTISPRTQSMIEGSGGGNPEALFEDGFRELAINQLMNEIPDLAEQIAAFKILESNTETNSAAGTFILLRGEDEVHIPAVLAENELMPFDIMYVKSLDIFLPLSEDWLTELDRMDASRLGAARKTPDTLRSDQDIRNVVVPPTTGRYSYASAGASDNRQLLPAYLSEAHNRVKESFLNTMERHPKIAQYVLEHYDHEDLKDAVKPHREKEAEIETRLEFVTIETPVRETRAIFGEDTPKAMKDIAEKGYAAKDDRDSLNQVVSKERPLSLQVPDSAGFYRVYLSDGTSPAALVFHKVLALGELRHSKTLGTETSRPHPEDNDTDTKTYRTIVTGDGRVICTKEDFVAESIPEEEVPDSLRNLVTKSNPRTPRNGQRGFFCDPTDHSLDALEPVKIEFVTLKNGTRFIQACTYTGDHVNIAQIKDSPIKAPRGFSGKVAPHGEFVSHRFLTEQEEKDGFGYDNSDTVLVPWHYKFVPIKDLEDPNTLLKDPESVTALFYDALSQSGAERVRLKNAGAGQVALGSELLDHVDAVKKLAEDHQISVEDAEYAVKTASSTHDASDFYVISPQAMEKFAERVRRAKTAQPAGPAPQGPPPEGMAPQGPPPEGMPPEGMAPEGMAPQGPPPPPPPNPLELAAQEIAQQVMQSNQEVQNQLITQQQSLETQMAVLEAVVQRANQISAEMQGMDAGPPVTAPPPQAPPPPSGGNPAEAMGAPPPGGAPAPAMGAPPPQAPPPEAGMAVEEPMAMEQAMALEDPEMFDAAAIASLAQQNEFDKAVSQFMPAFQEALDALGRILLDMRMKASELRERLGEQVYTELHEKAGTLFEMLGKMVIRLSEVVIDESSE